MTHIVICGYRFAGFHSFVFITDFRFDLLVARRRQHGRGLRYGDDADVLGFPDGFRRPRRPRPLSDQPCVFLVIGNHGMS